MDRGSGNGGTDGVTVWVERLCGVKAFVSRGKQKRDDCRFADDDWSMGIARA